MKSLRVAGRMILSGGSDGLIAVSSPNTGMTVRVITDHRGAPITNINVPALQVQPEKFSLLGCGKFAGIYSSLTQQRKGRGGGRRKFIAFP